MKEQHYKKISILGSKNNKKILYFNTLNAYLAMKRTLIPKKVSQLEQLFSTILLISLFYYTFSLNGPSKWRGQKLYISFWPYQCHHVYANKIHINVCFYCILWVSFFTSIPLPQSMLVLFELSSSESFFLKFFKNFKKHGNPSFF